MDPMWPWTPSDQVTPCPIPALLTGPLCTCNCPCPFLFPVPLGFALPWSSLWALASQLDLKGSFQL